MSLSPLIIELVDAFRCLPGVGPKSAQRMALHLLERDRRGGIKLASALVSAMEQVKHCSSCRNFTELELCDICSSQSRDRSKICIVENPVDVVAFEQTGDFRGYYFVLMGHLSPLDGIGPDDLGIDMLLERVRRDEVAEIILATNATVEGDATSHYIAEALANLPVDVTRIAHGVPVGGELEYVDSGTLAHALAGRKKV